MSDRINSNGTKSTHQKGISKNLLAVLIIFAAVAVCTAVLLTAGKLSLPGADANAVSAEKGLPVHDNFYVYSGDKLGFSFLYPKNRNVGFSEADGVYIYCGTGEAQPYVLVCRMNKWRMTPEKYFVDCDRYMLNRFNSVESTPIYQVKVGEKELHMVRYLCDGLVIDRYFEPYNHFYIQYTAISKEKGTLDTELYYAISTLRVSDDAYIGSYTDAVSAHSLDDIGISLKIPDTLDTKELTIGYFASSGNAIMLAVHITEDDNGKPIYNRQDFIDRAAEASSFVPGLLGADTATFTNGEEKSFGGKNFYCYPMQMQENGISFTGELCLANASETGCWLVAYAVREGSANFENSLKLLERCAASVKVK